MGRLVQRVKIQSLLNKEESLEVDALVDTGASIMALPGKYKAIFKSTELYDAESVTAGGVVPVKIGAGFLVQVGDFRATSADIAFIEGLDEPLIGYTLLEAIPVAVDMLGHRLVPVKYFDMK